MNPTPATPKRVLPACPAGEIMSPNPVSLEANASVQEALVLLTDRGFSAAPVIDDSGRPVGVLSRSDILVHEREYVHHALREGEQDRAQARRGGAGRLTEVEVVDPARVRDIMTPAVFTVPMHAPVDEVVRHMLELRVHQLFVIDEDQTLVGVITALDILRNLRPA
jgi:CBS domain-containing protein